MKKPNESLFYVTFSYYLLLWSVRCPPPAAALTESLIRSWSNSETAFWWTIIGGCWLRFKVVAKLPPPPGWNWWCWWWVLISAAVAMPRSSFFFAEEALPRSPSRKLISSWAQANWAVNWKSSSLQLSLPHLWFK